MLNSTLLKRHHLYTRFKGKTHKNNFTQKDQITDSFTCTFANAFKDAKNMQNHSKFQTLILIIEDKHLLSTMRKFYIHRKNSMHYKKLQRCLSDKKLTTIFGKFTLLI